VNFYFLIAVLIMRLRRDSRGDCRRKKGGKKESALASRRERARPRALAWTSEREREGERVSALSHDRARCNARAAMHKQRRASRSAPAKVTRVMSRCPLCRTNSAHSRPKALSRRVRSGASGCGTRGGGNRPTEPPSAPSLASHRAGICY